MKSDLVRLVSAQAILGTAMTMLVSFTALASKPIAPGVAWVTLPVTLQFMGLLLCTTPASFLMAQVGRRNGFWSVAPWAFWPAWSAPRPC